MLNMYQLVSNAVFSVNITQESPTFSEELENEIQHLWLAEQKKTGQALFNGKIMSATHISCNQINGYITEYRYFIAQRARPELFDVLKVRPVAVSGLFECVDGIIFGRRSNFVTQDQGLWELVPSGGIDTSKIDKNLLRPIKIDFKSQILSELYEEIGVGSESILDIYPFCVIEDAQSHVSDIGVFINSSLFYNQILECYQNISVKEYDKLQVIPARQIQEELMGHNKFDLIEATYALLQQFFKSNFSSGVIVSYS